MQVESGPSFSVAADPRKRHVSRVKAILVGILVVGAATAYAGGTFANFNAETDNGAVIQTSTLVLENQLGNPVSGVTDCYSTTGLGKSLFVPTSNSSACAAFFGPSGTVTGTDSTFLGKQFLTLTNLGSVNASATQLQLTCASVNNPGPNIFHGSGNLCSGLKVTVAETDVTFTNLVGTPLVGTCGGATVASCTVATGGAGTTATFNPATQAFNAAASRYWFVMVGLNNATDNALQGLQATMAFKWIVTE